MTSVPFSSTRETERKLLFPTEGVFAGNQYFFPLPPHLIRVRHIRSLWIKCTQTVYEEKTDDKNLQINTQKVNEKHRRDGSFSKNNHKHLLRSLRKGKSITDMKQKAKNEAEKYAKPYKNSLLSQSSEIRRQLKLQKTNSILFHDCFYSISNFMESENPYYVSHVFPAHSEISDEINLNIPNNSASISLFILHEENWRLYDQFHIKLSLLINLGTDLQFIKDQIQDIDGLLILRLADDCYYTLPHNDLHHETIVKLQEKFNNDVFERINNNSFHLESCTYDQIMALNNYSRCVQDLRSANAILASRIDNEVNNKSGLRYHLDVAEEQRNTNANLEKIIREKQEYNATISKRLGQLKTKREFLQQRILRLAKSDKSVERDVADEQKRYLGMNEELMYRVNVEKARMANAILRVFPIELMDGKFEFSLFGVSFPSSMIPHHGKYKHEHIEEIPLTSISVNTVQKLLQMPKSQTERLNALIGYISLILIIIFEILKIRPKYHIKFLGSTSYIHDYLSFNKKDETDSENLVKRSTIYPLFIYQNPTLTLKFTYGLFLLRKNLEQLYDIERLVKVEEFNLLTACKIWLTCVESYADVQFGNDTNEDVDVEESVRLDDMTGSLIPHDVEKDKVKRSDSTTSQSMETNVNSLVNEYNHNFLSEERIKHIKKHLLRGINK
ncbi:hypothetical protein CANINC_002715 [Pichia inconspicua]|uniref:UV radiation resistance-associated gene protein n=1 Tax=Pichia inconspicua TaxID=52247 RepID=A0A4T0X1R3_9ASCO|nr:hypothetical protein CANINC_002715 [[Candida] inconspicua]